ncbi:arf-GAP with Rho-GAP domain, ANK repeat and PH domain-containing protein 2 [Daktulosphaira vitifoliae]|uniref:arf-GAP with Rho-GAP domain, ANK repeat and PH domain-containing protein 2 n=1 Tax=Daktulosphaira vitifoliae TaxID=58002 RepID=UPI0021A98F7D|nr:arf-GAP with Rho-GAP domain, ANK repeat and PH domain-containing protein 2 [Daktulosphaira vitifoliae]XP_050548625.1 arf-GAP with Rho-GAP domain, ANK repeat and PH domain-containing protein 2 [Daktulosphaira vitifoliae]XP_050548626.1 arf-GAP with Rho-GAP domain, ANK repeat and PH domain-containing protein 2 [Daktulosphaira vitifoliae]
MENTNYYPIPPPRTTKSNECLKKKPVPLPRKNVNNSKLNSYRDSSYSIIKEEVNSLYRKHIKPEIKMSSDNVQDRKKAVIENTKNVGIRIEKSFRSLLPKPARRHTISQTFEEYKSDIVSESSVEDNDIFSSISFDSPIPLDSSSERSFSIYNAESDIYGSQPPNFPPPPLPKDLLYDQVLTSSNSSSQCGSYTNENIYELISISQAKSSKNMPYENWNYVNKFQTLSTDDLSSNDAEFTCKKSDKNSKELSSENISNIENNNYDNNIVMFEFDPLHDGNDSVSKIKIENEDCVLLKEIDEILYSSNQYSIDDKSLSDYELNNFVDDLNTIPEPPERVDSIVDCGSSKLKENYEVNPNTIETAFKTELQEEPIYEKSRKNSIKNWLNMKHTVKKVTEGSSDSVRKIRLKLKPIEVNKKEESVVIQSNIFHNGTLFICLNEKSKDLQKNWCQIAGNYLKYSKNKGQIENSILLTTISSIQIINEIKQSDLENIYCFKINFLPRVRSVTFGALSTTERRVWMQKFLETVTCFFPSIMSSEFSRAGRTTLKEGINSEWIQSWILLHNRNLIYINNNNEPELVDLRKVRNVVANVDNDLQSTVLFLDYVTKSIYMCFEGELEVIMWQQTIKAETVNTTPHLIDQQLNKDQVPVIVDKCVNFIYTHGCLSEGVYRRSGSCSNATKLLSEFRKDAWAVQLSHQEYSEYDVASVLKRFFRDLPEPLLTTELHTHFCNAVRLNCEESEKVILYRSLLERLAPINYVTTRKLMGHLYYIQQQSDKNLMTVQNLASIWGPTLMHLENNDSQNWSKTESEVVNDLILLYPKLFHVEDDEIKREDRILEALKYYHLASGNTIKPSKPSGDLKIWIYLGSKDGGNCVNVTLNPSKTAEMVCKELANKMGVCAGYLLGLQEVVCNGSLIRPIHHSEFLLDIVLRWAYWDIKYRRDNYIICLQPNSLLIEIMPFTKEPVTISSELKFADQKNRSFKSYLFEINEGKLLCYKDKSGSSILYEWNIKSLIWYIGFVPKRNPHTRWCITFILKDDPTTISRENFGFSIAGTTKEDHLRWMAALLIAEYGVNNVSPPVSINLLDC